MCKLYEGILIDKPKGGGGFELPDNGTYMSDIPTITYVSDRAQADISRLQDLLYHSDAVFLPTGM